VVRESPKPLRLNSTGTVSQDPKPSPSRKKRVAFVEDVKKEERQRFSGHQGRESASKQPAVPRYSGRITELTEDEEEHSSPVVPIDESPEDVALRREMLKYTFSDVGAVVAELDLDEDSQYSYSDDCDEDQETSSVEGEEDMFGRTTRRVVSDKYREEMEALERKLNARAMENVGPRPNELPLSGVAEDLKQLPALQNASTKTKPDELKKPAKRGVRFAEELDIVPAPQNTTTGAPEIGGLLPPLEESVFEQGSITGSRTEPSPPTTRRVSKFKSSRAPAAEQPSNSPILQESANVRGSLAKGPLKEGVIERSLSGVGPSLPLVPSVAAKNGYQFSSPAVPHEETRAAPEGPSGKVLSDSIIERSTADYSTGPPDPDGLDPALLRQEIAMEYHHMRNRMIQREGGFMPREEELERVPLTVEEGGSGRKVSRFKAARLGKRVGP
jgi:unconventional prefoldin RPB5 interactor 1